MKKIQFSFLILALIIILTGCENFLAGGDFRDKLNEQIEYANAPESTIYIMADNLKQGTTYPDGPERYKVYPKVKNPISFKVSAEYVFKYWEVVNKDTLATVTDIIDITDPTALETTFTYKTKASVPILIRPVCAVRPAINSQVPMENSENTKDTSIVITFSEKLSEDIDLESIYITSDGVSVKEHYMEPVLNGTTITIAANLSNLITVPENKTKTITVSIPDTFFYIKDDIKIPLASGKKWDFKINNNTSQKAEIIFSAAENQGTIIPYAANSYNIGDTVNLSFDPKPGIRFIKWNVLDSEGHELNDSILLNKEEPNTKISILKAIKGVSIYPVTELIPMVTGSVIPAFADTGVPAYSKISVNFITPMNPEDLNETFKNISITCDGYSINDKFQLPELSSDGKLLTIKPIAGELEKLVTNAVAEITVKLHKEMRSMQPSKSGLEEDFIWTYRINKNNADLMPPKLDSVILKMNNANGKILVTKDCSLWEDDDYKQNHIKDTVWVSCEGSDDDSGVKTVKITETLLYAPDGTSINKIPDNSHNESGIFLENKPGQFSAEFEYKLHSSQDGIIQLDFVLYDNANIPSEKKSIYVIKDTTVPRNMEISNKQPTAINDFDSPRTINIMLDSNTQWATNINNSEKKYNSSFTDTLYYGFSRNSLTPAVCTKNMGRLRTYYVETDFSKNTILQFHIEDEVGNKTITERFIPHSVNIIYIESDEKGAITINRQSLFNDTELEGKESFSNVMYNLNNETWVKYQTNGPGCSIGISALKSASNFKAAVYPSITTETGQTIYGGLGSIFEYDKNSSDAGINITKPSFVYSNVIPGPKNSKIYYYEIELTSPRETDVDYYFYYPSDYYKLDFNDENKAIFPIQLFNTTSTVTKCCLYATNGSSYNASEFEWGKSLSEMGKITNDFDLNPPNSYGDSDLTQRSALYSRVQNLYSYDGSYIISKGFRDEFSGLKEGMIDGKTYFQLEMNYLESPDFPSIWTKTANSNNSSFYADIRSTLYSKLQNTAHNTKTVKAFPSYKSSDEKPKFYTNFVYAPDAQISSVVPIKDIEEGSSVICDFVCYDNADNYTSSNYISWYGTIRTLTEKPALSISNSKLKVSIPDEGNNHTDNYMYNVVIEKLKPIDAVEKDYEWSTCRAYDTTGQLDKTDDTGMLYKSKDDSNTTLTYSSSDKTWSKEIGMGAITSTQIPGEDFSDSFIKVNIMASDFTQYIKKDGRSWNDYRNWMRAVEPAYSYPVYIYTGNNICKSKNYQELHGKLQISHDRPCFVQTVCSAKDRGDNVDEWERRGEKLNKQYFFTESFTLSDYEPRLDDIPSGDYYRYIIHYADGSYQMTETKRK